MLKRVEEDWSYFNAAVREKAQGKLWQEPPPFGLAPLPDPGPPRPASQLPQPQTPAAAPPPTPPHTVNPIPTALHPRPTNDDGTLPRQEPPPFRLAPLPDPAPRPASQPPLPQPPAAASPPTPPHTVNPIPTAARPPPTGDGMLPKFFSRLFLIVLAIIGLLWLIALGNDRTHVTSTVANPVGAYSTPPPASSGTNAVVTNYTLFKTVALGDWQVVTGWNFRRSGDETPFEQYCYVGAETLAGKPRYDIETRHGATSRTKHPQPDALVPGLSEAVWSEAAQKCQWHH